MSYKWRVNIFPDDNTPSQHCILDSVSMVFNASKDNVYRYVKSYLFDNGFTFAKVSFIDEGDDFKIETYRYYFDPKPGSLDPTIRNIDNFTIEKVYSSSSRNL